MRRIIRRQDIDRPGDRVFETAMTMWHAIHADASDPMPLIAALETLCGPSVNLYLTDMNGDSPLGYQHSVVQYNFDLRRPADIALGEYPDRRYVDEVVLPFHESLRVEQAPNFCHIETPVMGHYGVYDRLMLPLPGQGGGVQACLSLSRLHIAVEIPRDPTPELSPRERQCLNLLANGHSAKRIAAELDLSPKTVEKQIHGLKRKLKAKNVTQAVARGIVLLLD